MLVKWMGLLPPLMLIAYVLKWLNVEPLWLKLLMETAILVPLLNYVITPLMDSLFSEWLYEGIDGDAQRQSVDVGA